MQSRRALPLVVAAAIGLTGCGMEVRGTLGEPRVENLAPRTSSSALPPAAPTASGDVRTRTAVTVLDAGDGPQLCAGPVAESSPPQCSGPDIEGWRWRDHAHDKKSGVRWTTATLLGTYDGETFTLAEVSDEQSADDAAADELLDTPCPVPAGGWAVLDAGTTNADALESARAAAAGFDGTETWLDPTGGRGTAATAEFISDAPGWVVLNVATAGDVEDVERKVREVWGGKLCVSNALRVGAAVERGLRQLPGLVTTGTARNGAAVAEVLFDDGTLQTWVDATYGAGAVDVVSALVPVT